ncbi:laccase-15-like isoform X2 [Aristolochia californica]|uniref:laccase-15-like isoform X2 n=1 Tax=Aristolochia californica TaxID=171875 RepID=UPI0035E02FC9
MGLMKGLLMEVILCSVLLHGLLQYMVSAHSSLYQTFDLKEVTYSRLCENKTILTVNGLYPGPTLFVHRGETAIVKVYNRAPYNITIHWHGVKQPRNPWSDGPEYITQCPIQPGSSFTYRIVFSTEEGTLWWHAHSDWARATVHGAIVIYPKPGTSYPFPKPYHEMPIILGEWWKRDVNEVLEEALQLGGDPEVSDAFTINGQPGDLLPCSKRGITRMVVNQGKSYLLRIINAGMNEELFFSVAKHRITVVGTDGSYVKPLTADYIMITPGQTMDVLFEANRTSNRYYMAASAYSSGTGVPFDNTTTTAILQYRTHNTSHSSPLFPTLPAYNDTAAATSFIRGLRSLANEDHPVRVPSTVDKHLYITISVNTLPCSNSSCEGPDGDRLAASMNNISFVNPSIDILRAYYLRINGVYGDDFPSEPPLFFNFTADNLPQSLLTPEQATEVKVLEYNARVEMVFQGTNLVAGENHPMHLHGFSFYVVGWGFGNYNKEKDSSKYNLIDPPLVNTVGVPKNGWAAIRFRADNPVFIVKNGHSPSARLSSPPPNMPPC